MKVIVCGGRDYDGPVFTSLCERFQKEERNRVFLLLGGARGTDSKAAHWAAACGVNYRVFRADWDTHGKAAGPIRNQQMIDAGAELVIAFPGGRGTEDMVRRAEKAGITVERLP